jgi:pimeloyl-ACP methyl ester carboxylesterase
MELRLSKGCLLTLEKSGDLDQHWLFLPGGPGIGSESIRGLIKSLSLKGHCYRVDLPGDGSHRMHHAISLKNWQQALLEAASFFKNVVLVGHSFGAMLMQTIPELEPHLKGMVWLNAAPNCNWFYSFRERAISCGLPDPLPEKMAFLQSPTYFQYSLMMKHSIPYQLGNHRAHESASYFESLALNEVSYLWGLTEFHPFYRATWLPVIPTFIFISQKDVMIPPDVFNDKSFDRENFTKCVIENGCHLPWFDDPQKIRIAFQHFEKKVFQT